MDYEKKQRLIALRDSMKSYGYIDGVEELDSIFPDLVGDEEDRIRSAMMRGFNSMLANQAIGTFAGEPIKNILSYLEKQKEQSITANDLDEEIHRFFDDCIDVHEAKLYGSISERVIPVDCYELTARHFAKWGEKQKEQGPEEKPINWTELTWKDIVELEGIINNVHYEFRNGIGQEFFGKEVLEKFREYKGDEYLDGIEQKPVDWNFPCGVNETADKLIAIAECLEMDGNCQFNGLTGTECGKFLRELARKQVECEPAEWSEDDKQYLLICENAIDRYCWEEKWSAPTILKWFNEHLSKQKWSEEDENNLKRAINICVNDFGEESETAKFLKSLPERLNLHSKQGLSEDELKVVIDEGKDDIDKGFTRMMEKGQKHPIQIVNLNKAIVEDIRNGVPTKTIEETRGVKFATPIGKEQKPAEEHHDLTEILVPPQLPQNLASGDSEKPNNQWSEEDETAINGAIEILLADYLPNEIIGTNTRLSIGEIVKRLKSLRPQPHWKPSEEQMETLKSCFHINPATGELHSPSLDEIYMLGSLYNDLEKIVGNEQ